MIPEDRFDVLRVSLIPRIGSTRGRLLLRAFGTFKNILSARAHDIAAVDGISIAVAGQVHSALHSEGCVTEIEKTVERNVFLLEKQRYTFTTIFDENFPRMLRKIYDPPLFLFIDGRYSEAFSRSIAVVGSRTPTDYGRRCATFIAEELSSMGVVTVSGLALGIDAIAHSATVSSGGTTIAVLGSGVNNVYPFGNRKLASRIREKGCVLSELPLEANPDAMNFPRRNRIISGLTLGTIVVESGIKGGAIITAELALDQNREVFAVPGSIFNSRSDGPNFLIKKGLAHPLTCVEDIFEELPTLRSGKSHKAPREAQLTILEEAVVKMISLEPVHIDELVMRTGWKPADLLVQLLQLEFKDIVRQLPGKFFVRSRM